MKEYMEPVIEIIEYHLSDIIALSQPKLDDIVNPETSIPDWIPTPDDDW